MIKQKGVAEIVSSILVILIVVIAVGIVMAGLLPEISKSKAKIKFEESNLARDKLYSEIIDTYNLPIGSTKQIDLSLDGLTLDVNGDSETITIYYVTDNPEFYKDQLRVEEDNGKYTYRDGQKLITGIVFDNIDIVRSYIITNQANTKIYIKKISAEKIQILLDNETGTDWYSSSDSYIYENEGTWNYRQKILIDHNKVDANLNNFPVLIKLSNDALSNYSKSDGSDIIFTTSDGKTKLKREIDTIDLSKKKKITINHLKVDSNLTDYPMLISITDNDLKTYARSDGANIYFKDSSGTILKREIEYYNSSSSALIAWVKIPTLSSTVDTDIYMHIANSDVIYNNDTDVWDSNYKLVQHFNSTLLDSTVNGNNGSYSGGLTATSSYLNNGIEGTNSAKLVTIPHTSSLDINNTITVQAIVKFTYLDYTTNTGINNIIAMKGNPDQVAAHKGWWFRYQNATNIKNFNYTCFGNSAGGYMGGGNTFGAVEKIFVNGTYNFITFTIKDNNVGYLYVDGNLLEQKNLTGLVLSQPSNALTIGGGLYGSIDEFRISNFARSASWIKTEYNNLSSPNTFYTIGPIENLNIFSAWVKIPELSSTKDTVIYIYFGNTDANVTNDKDTWNNDYKGVWHLKETGINPQIFDSTINNNNSTSNLADPNTSGKIGGAMTFTSANSDYINITDNSSLDVSTTTLSAWINLNTWAGYPGIITKGYWDGGGEAYGMHIRDNLSLWMDINNSGSRAFYNPTTKVLTLGNWHYVTTTVSSSTIRIYIDGIESGTGQTGTYNLSTTDHNLFIGRMPGFGYINGVIDDVRISNISRSAQWIKTEYNNQSNPIAFIKTGIVEKS